MPRFAQMDDAKVKGEGNQPAKFDYHGEVIVLVRHDFPAEHPNVEHRQDRLTLKGISLDPGRSPNL